jgi:hypothetical protein
MSRGPSTFRKHDVKRAIAAVRSAGCQVAGVVIGPDGSIHVKVGEPANDNAPAPAANPWDSLLTS